MCADKNKHRTSGHLKLVPRPPLVTVVIPAYNAAKYLIESLDSVLAQSFGDFEVIVVDDGSTDETPEILTPYLDVIRYIRTENRGPSSARNLAIRESRGELIAFQDADDVWLPEKLALQVELLEARPGLGVAFTGSERFNERETLDCNLTTGSPVPSGWVFDELLSRHFIALSTVVVRRSCLDAVGGFDESLVGAEDYNLFLRLAHSYQFGLVSKVLVRKRCHDEGLSEDLESMYRDEIANLDQIADLFPNAHIRTARLKAEIHLRFGRYYFTRSDYQKARRCFVRALRQPASPWEALVYLAVSTLPGRLRAWLISLKRRNHRQPVRVLAS